MKEISCLVITEEQIQNSKYLFRHKRHLWSVKLIEFRSSRKNVKLVAWPVEQEMCMSRNYLLSQNTTTDQNVSIYKGLWIYGQNTQIAKYLLSRGDTKTLIALLIPNIFLIFFYEIIFLCIQKQKAWPNLIFFMSL